MSGIIVHEWLERVGGAERVVDAMMATYPEADLLCLWSDRPAAPRVKETWLARTPLRRHKAMALPFELATWRAAHLGHLDWALVSSHAFAHHVRVPAGVPKFVYVHSPARYLWHPEADPRGAGRTFDLIRPPLQMMDRTRAREIHAAAANSHYIAARIEADWGMGARVIYPPVAVTEIQAQSDWAEVLDSTEATFLGSLPEGFILGASRFAGQKRLDRVITAGNLTGRPVVLAGSGPLEAELRAYAALSRVPVHFALAPSDALLRALYQRAAVYLFPPTEDFGIMPVEAMAAGARVAVHSEGGASESVAGAGIVCDMLDDEALITAIADASHLDRDMARRHAQMFDEETFRRELREWVTHG